MALIDDYRNIDPNTINSLGVLQQLINEYENGNIASNPLTLRGGSEKAIDEAARVIAANQGISFEDAKESIVNNPKYVEDITSYKHGSKFGKLLQPVFTDVPGLEDALYNVKDLLDENQRKDLAKFLETSTAAFGSKYLPGASTIAQTDTWKNMSNIQQLVYLNEFIKKFKENPEQVKKILQDHSGRHAVQAWEGDLIAFNQKQKPGVKRTDNKPKEEVALPVQQVEHKPTEEEIKEQAKNDRIHDLALKLAALRDSTPAQASSIGSLQSYTPNWWGAV